MDFLLQPLEGMEVYAWEQFIDNWFFVFALGLLVLEFIRYGVMKRITWNLIGDTITNYITLAAFITITFLGLAALYIASYFYTYQFAIFDIEINWLTIAICVVLADLAYYWAHRFMHMVNVAWATHTVHHSSPHFNISVAYRFGPMDGLWPVFFHIPLVLVGFNPFVVFFAEVFVQLYQTALHTEVLRRLPKPIEAIMNTPSHHRVHHGSNPEYLDTNYAGIFIIWDRMFGTFAEEKEPVVYGLVRPINSVNPFIVFFHGLYRVGRDIFVAKGWRNKLDAMFGPPGWEARHKAAQEAKMPSGALTPAE